MDERLYPLEWLDEQVMTGAAGFWFTDNAAIVAEIKTYPSGARAIHGLVAAGSLPDITNILIPKAESWGAENGCSLSIIESRAGWARQMKPYGYELHQTALRKDI